MPLGVTWKGGRERRRRRRVARLTRCTEWPHPLRGKGLVLGRKQVSRAGLGRTESWHARLALPSPNPSPFSLGVEGGRGGHTCAAATRCTGGERGEPWFQEMARSISNRLARHFIHSSINIVQFLSLDVNYFQNGEVRFYEYFIPYFFLHVDPENCSTSSSIARLFLFHLRLSIFIFMHSRSHLSNFHIYSSSFEPSFFTIY